MGVEYTLMNLIEQFAYAHQESVDVREAYAKRFGIKPYRLFIDPQTDDIISEATKCAERKLARSYMNGDEIPLAVAVASSLHSFTTRGKYNHGRIIAGGDFSLGSLLKDASCIERSVFAREIFDNFGVESKIEFVRLLGIPFHHFVHVTETDEVIDPIVPLMLRERKFHQGYFQNASLYHEQVSRLNTIGTLPDIIWQIGRVTF